MIFFKEFNLNKHSHTIDFKALYSESSGSPSTKYDIKNYTLLGQQMQQLMKTLGHGIV